MRFFGENWLAIHGPKITHFQKFQKFSKSNFNFCFVAF
jgi:hypothetical protein